MPIFILLLLTLLIAALAWVQMSERHWWVGGVIAWVVLLLLVPAGFWVIFRAWKYAWTGS